MKAEAKKGLDVKAIGEKAGQVAKGAGAVAKSAGNAVVTAGGKAKDLAANSKETVVNAIDQNGNGEIDIEDVIIMGMKVPGIRIDRAEFLQKCFMKKYPQDVIDDAIANNPLHAHISLDEINVIADEVINFERLSVSGISAALGTPGGFAMVATIPADIAQYYGYMLRATQKLLYLYGFPEIDTDEKGSILDDGTMSTLIVCMGVMYGVAGASKALKAMAKALANGVEKKLLSKALTKGTIYPIVKSVASWFGKRMTREVFAGFFEKSIPVVGVIAGGAITFLTFKPCCDRLKESLQDTLLSNPDYKPKMDEDIVIAEV